MAVAHGKNTTETTAVSVTIEDVVSQIESLYDSLRIKDEINTQFIKTADEFRMVYHGIQMPWNFQAAKERYVFGATA